MQDKKQMKATGGRDASRERRSQLVQGKIALPSAGERVRTGQRNTPSIAQSATPAAPIATHSIASLPTTTVASASSSVPAQASTSSGMAQTGREASKMRRAGLVQGKSGLQQQITAQTETLSAPQPRSTSMTQSHSSPVQATGRGISQAIRAARARNGRDEASATRPSGRVRNPTPINYPPKVVDSETYTGKKVTGVRIGRGRNMTGDEPGADVQVTGSQYLGKETGLNPREGGTKVGATRTQAGLVVTGSQVRSKIMITGDESNSSINITGEADQRIDDDLLNRREQGAYTSMQFQRQNNPHGHTVFGANLGRSIKSIGSRDRDSERERATEMTDGGMQISGTAVGRSVRVTGDEPGSCRPITGDQYLMPAVRQPQCDTQKGLGSRRIRTSMGMPGNASGDRADPVTGEKVVVSETWARQRITGVDVEYNANVSGDEYGVCSPITGTPYAGPGQYEAFCASSDAAAMSQRVNPGMPAGTCVTGDTPLNVSHVTGTQRGSEHGITGTPYFREEMEAPMKGDVINNINSQFSVHSPQREAHLHADASAAQAPTAEGRITGTFAAGAGKITGNQEFNFSPRGKAARSDDKSRITGEGRMEGPTITGGAWGAQKNVSGTEGYIAAERNPSERVGTSHTFASACKFKGKGNHVAPTQHVTGMVGWSSKTAARVTLTGGGQG